MGLRPFGTVERLTAIIVLSGAGQPCSHILEGSIEKPYTTLEGVS
jgi:hypothetical protein